MAKTSGETSLASDGEFIMKGSSPAEHRVLFLFYIEIEPRSFGAGGRIPSAKTSRLNGLAKTV